MTRSPSLSSSSEDDVIELLLLTFAPDVLFAAASGCQSSSLSPCSELEGDGSSSLPSSGAWSWASVGAALLRSLLLVDMQDRQRRQGRLTLPCFFLLGNTEYAEYICESDGKSSPCRQSARPSTRSLRESDEHAHLSRQDPSTKRITVTRTESVQNDKEEAQMAASSIEGTNVGSVRIETRAKMPRQLRS